MKHCTRSKSKLTVASTDQPAKADVSKKECPEEKQVTVSFCTTHACICGSMVMILDSVLKGSVVTESIITDSVLTDSVVPFSIVTDSIVTNSVVTDSVVKDSVVMDYLLYAAHDVANTFAFNSFYLYVFEKNKKIST
jgi:hypothetical protein